MVTVSHIVKDKIKESSFLRECFIKDIVSYTNLAADLHPLVEKELGKKVNVSAILMALRREADKIREKGIKKIPKNFFRDITVKTNVIDICLRKTEDIFRKIRELHKEIDYEQGEFINIIDGDNELVIVTNENCMARINKKFLKNEIKSKETSLVSINLRFKGDFLHTPGIIYSVLRELAWYDINIYELISTNLELNIILNKKDFIKAYNLLSQMFEKQDE